MRRIKSPLLAVSVWMLAASLFLPVHAEETELPSPSQEPGTENDPVGPIPTMPEDMPVIPEGKTAKLILRYFDDEDETIPATGTEFTIYQVASIGRDVDNNGMYVPLEKDLSFHDAPEVDEYQKRVVSKYTENPKIGVTRTEAIQDNGEAVFEDLQPGAYFVTETKTIRYHLTSKSFLVSAPETSQSGKTWNFEVKADVKPNLAGDLSVQKILKGTDTNPNEVFHFRVTIPPEGEYRIKMPDGSEAAVRNGDTVPIKGGQSFTIYDLPDQSEYEVSEVEDGQNGYITTVNHTKGKIEYAAEQEASITNRKDRVKTFVSTGGLTVALSLFGGAAAVLAIVLYALIKQHRNNRKDAEETKESREK